MEEQIILNRIQCNHCKQIIDSHFTHDFKSCSCGIVSVDGGRNYLRRCMATGDSDYTELSVMSSAPFEKLREALLRGSRGKDGKQPLTYVALSSISNSYLDNIIKYQVDNNYTDSIDYQLQIKEKFYRLEHGIIIGE